MLMLFQLQMSGKTALLLVGIIFVLSASCCCSQITDPREVEALLAVRKKLKDPYNNLNWTKKHDPCTSNWTGVFCYMDATDGYMHVQELRMFRYNLSGKLAPELGQLPHLKRLDFLWNHLSGSIPKEIGNTTALELLLLSGNQLSGPLPDELGYLPNLTKFQLDLNMISGSLPRSFANLPRVQHFHMNNNNFSGQIPPELSTLPLLRHFLLDNNNLSGYLPPEFSEMRSLTILQLDNNNFAGTLIPNSYRNMTRLLKLSLRNCGLQGTIPDLSGLHRLLYLDLSMNKLSGNIISNRMSENITTIVLSHNELNGSIPSNFSGLPHLQKLYLDNNLLSGSLPSTIWDNITLTADTKLDINFEENLISDISGVLDIPPNVTLLLRGNPVCSDAVKHNISLICGTSNQNQGATNTLDRPLLACLPQSCPTDNYFEYVPTLPNECFCAAPFGVGLRLRSPSISDFVPYREQFDVYITSNVFAKQNIALHPYQLYVDSIAWESGPRLRMFLLFFPEYSNSTNTSNTFSSSEIQAIANTFAGFTIPGSDIFGPYDLLNFTAQGPYSNVPLPSIESGGLSRGALAGIILGSITCASLILISFLLCYRKLHQKSQEKDVEDQPIPKAATMIAGVKAFSFDELRRATGSFGMDTEIGQGGYGKVYKGTLGDGTGVAIKRAEQGSLQGNQEFYTEIEMLSRLHHRNLVPLLGYCDEKGEQMLVYEFMPNGSLHGLLYARGGSSLDLKTRLDIALGAARGILYLHTEADPPIIHRDIKANNILLDSKLMAKVSDFGISRLAPVQDARGATTAHVSTNVKGTPGYVDPEYFWTHKLTEKSDVYSLGVVFLELLTGMQPISHGRHIVTEVRSARESGTMHSIMQSSSPVAGKMMDLALACCVDETKDRPSILQVVRGLENLVNTISPHNTDTYTNTSTSTSTDSDRNENRGRRSSSFSSHTHTVSMDPPLITGVFNTIVPR